MGKKKKLNAQDNREKNKITIPQKRTKNFISQRLETYTLKPLGQDVPVRRKIRLGSK